VRRDSFRLLLLAGVVAFAVLYGMDLSSRGINRVYGPMDQQPGTDMRQQQQQSESGDWTLPSRNSASRQQTSSGRSQYQEPTIPRNDSEPLIDRVSGTAAETLHGLSSGGIRFIVSLFDKVTGS